jgi:hypothetical protein
MKNKDYSMQTRPFGVEVELSTDKHEVNKIIRNILPRQSYVMKTNNAESKGKRWELKNDFSTECEFVTPVLTLNNNKYDLFCKTLGVLKTEKVKVTDKDGLHVHFDVSDIPPINIITLWLTVENALMQLMPKSRQKNWHCCRYNSTTYTRRKDYNARAFESKPVGKLLYDAALEFKDKSLGLSFMHYDDRKTIEFRIHEGCIDKYEIDGWIKFCLYFLKRSKELDVMNVISSKGTGDVTVANLFRFLRIKNKEMDKWRTARLKMIKGCKN